MLAGRAFIAVANHCRGLYPVFSADMGWPVQSNLGSIGFVTLSAFWLTWRHTFAVRYALLLAAENRSGTRQER
jgi:hypothetical protein